MVSSFSIHRHPCHSRESWSFKSSILTDINFNESTGTSSTVQDLNHEDTQLFAKVPETMKPLSRPPLLLLKSSSPIITKEGCELLIRHFRRKQSKSCYGICDEQVENNAFLDEEGHAEKLLDRIHDVIDEVTGCPRHAGETSPRYVLYKPKIATVSEMAESGATLLLPDGLHVDTNNGKLFRHITAILYLTDNNGDELLSDEVFQSSSSFVGGATTFPLANGKESAGVNAAMNLLKRGIHHTKADCNNVQDSDGKILEKMGLDLFFRDNNQSCRDSKTSMGLADVNAGGVRVMPEAGSLIYFHNVGNDGRPDPASFHGGEELIALFTQNGDLGSRYNKSILVFFKEVPLESFRDEAGFAKRAEQARKWTLDEYYR